MMKYQKIYRYVLNDTNTFDLNVENGFIWNQTKLINYQTKIRF